MRLFRLFLLNFIFIFSFLFFPVSIFSMLQKNDQQIEQELSEDLNDLDIGDSGEEVNQEINDVKNILPVNEDFYQSDSEDEDNYVSKGYDNLKISEDHGEKYLVLFRGIHFSPSNNFGKKQISEIRRTNEIGKPIFSKAAYDLASVNFIENINFDDKKVIDLLFNVAEQIKQQITNLTQDQRNKFQQLYTNQYNKFHSQLIKPDSTFNDIFKNFKSDKNPQVSTSESFRHAGRYAFGQKFIGEGIKLLDPEYDENGKAKHPYLGKVYVILVDISKIKELDPYFVVNAHANKNIKVFTHFANSILAEREVSFPGYIPGECVVFEQVIRVPSTITGEYKNYYESKYGFSKKSFNTIKNKIESINKILKNLPNVDKSLLSKALNQKKAKESIIGGFFGEEDSVKKLEPKQEEQLKKILLSRKKDMIKNLIESVIENVSKTLECYIKSECTKNKISIVYKNIKDDDFCEEFPEIKDAKKMAEA